MKLFKLFPILISILFLQGNIGCQERREGKNVSRVSLWQDLSPSEKKIEKKYASGELIVKFKSEAFDEEGNLVSESINALNNKYGLVSMEQIFKGKPVSEFSNIYKLKFPTELNVMELMQEYQKDPSIIYVEPNYIVHIMK